jgi:hypothetical protein
MAKKASSPAGKHRPNAGSFKKGDSRINRNGPIKTGVLAFNRNLRELIVAEGEQKHTTLVGDEGKKVKVTFKKVEWMVKVLWNAAMKGEPWAVQFIAERTEGKVTQPVSGELSHTLKFSFGENGNGKEHG